MKPPCALPQEGLPLAAVMQQLQERRSKDFPWESGRLFGYTYWAGEEVKKVAIEAIKYFFNENALNPTAFPSIRQMEAELIAQVAALLHAPKSVGICTSGGTQSILSAMLAARERARARGQKSKWRVIVPHTIHPAFDKAAHLLDVQLIKTPTQTDGKASPQHIAAAIDTHTIMIAGSAPCWPWGLVDPLYELSMLAQKHDIWFHVDACVGGMFLPFLPKQHQPLWDFQLPGVQSISVDLHKYGYAPKGISLLLFRHEELRRFQYFTATDWPGGLFATPGIAGTRSGAIIAAAWAVMRYLGRKGYQKRVQQVMEATHKLQQGIEATGHLQVVGQPAMSIVACTSRTLDIYQVADELALHGWIVGRQQNPPTLHFILNPLHVSIVDELLHSLHQAIEAVLRPSPLGKMRQWTTQLSTKLLAHLPAATQDRLIAWSKRFIQPTPQKRQAVIYGMVGALKAEEQVEKVLIDYLDRMFVDTCSGTDDL